MGAMKVVFVKALHIDVAIGSYSQSLILFWKKKMDV
jgi:hypothetical protein